MSQTTSRLQIEKMMPLPVYVGSHALAQEWRGELWLLINQPGNQKTQVLKITSSHQVESIAALPLMAASMNSCDGQLIVTGSNAKGQPLVIGLNAKGQLLWEYLLSGPEPTIWPIVACGPMPVIVWQQTPDQIERGLLDTKSATLLRKPAIAVRSPPVRIYSWKNQLWGIWVDKMGIHIIDLAETSERVVSTGGKNVNEFSVGQSRDGAYFGWTSGNQTFWLLPETLSSILVDYVNTTGGTFNLISGGAPLMWIQKSKQNIDGDLEWESTLLMPSSIPIFLDGYVFAVAWWQQQVVVVNQSMVLLLDS